MNSEAIFMKMREHEAQPTPHALMPKQSNFNCRRRL